MANKQMEDWYDSLSKEQRENWYNQTFNSGYRKINSLPPASEEKGVECGVCGMRFDHGKCYGFVCTTKSCPMFPQITC